MKFLIHIFFIISFFNGLIAQDTYNQIVIEDINIIDVKTGKIKTQNVLIVGKQIAKIGSFTIKKDSSTLHINGKSKYLLPGYYDMHVHINEGLSPNDYRLLCYNYLINGVTSLRLMRQFDINEAYRDSINTNLILGPTFNLCQPEIEFFRGFNRMSQSFDNYKNKGYLFVKYLSGMPYPHLDSISKLLKAKNIALVGHVHDNTLQHNLDFNFRSIEHLKPFTETLKKDSATLYNKQFKQIASKNIFICPTILWYNYSWDQISKTELFSFPELNFISKTTHSKWTDEYTEYEKTFIIAKNEQYSKEKKEFAQDLLRFDKILQTMNTNKIKLLIGSDDAPFIVAGYGFHREVELFKKAKLPNLDILNYATHNGAECLYQENILGSIELNKIADLVILNKNPLDNISDLKNINAVIKFGKYYTLTDLFKLRDGILSSDNK